MRFGRVLFFVNLFTYVGYLACLTAYVLIYYPGELYKVSCNPHLNESVENNDRPASHQNYTGKMQPVDGTRLPFLVLPRDAVLAQF